VNIANWLHDQARCHPRWPALFLGSTPVTDYRGFAARAAAIATRLQDRYGIGPGDRVALFMKNNLDYLPVMYGIWWAGAVAVPVNAKLHAAEAAWIVDNAQSRLVVTTAGDTLTGQERQYGEEIAVTDLPVAGDDTFQPPATRRPHDLAWLFYTSGTTGRSKGAMLSHNNLVSMSLVYPLDVDPVDSADAILYAAPMSHGAGLYNFIHVRRGARHVVPESQGFDAGEVLQLARELDCVSMFAAPTMVKRLVDEARRRGEDGAGIKTIVYGGGPMYTADIRDALDVLGSRFVQIYGQGESPMAITALQREYIANREMAQWEQKVATAGRAQSCVDVRVVGRDHRPLPAGEPGEIVARGPTVMLGYWHNDEATRKTLVDGWLHTGDIGTLDADGFLTLTDRSKDVIISGGSNIYPREIEEVLLQHPAVHEVSVVGEKDLDWGENVVAFVVADDVDDETLTDWFKNRMASFKKPKKYIFCAELPQNNYGKVMKTELRKQLPGNL
jgi:long-chain acyl-CoA synthetase